VRGGHRGDSGGGLARAMSGRVVVLDHGYVEPIDAWGSDERIIEAARMSTGKGFLGWGPRCKKCDGAFLDSDGPVCLTPGCGGTERKSGDEKLLRFLWENKHQTPFEMAGLTIEVQAPIFVFREWHRHRVPFGYNEMSARYTPLPDVNYIPSVERLMINASTTNKQAGRIAGAASLTAGQAEEFRARLAEIYVTAEDVYQAALADGVPKELARVHLPVGRYSRMRATSNLRGWLGFLALRMASGAQWEIRQYANVVGGLIAEYFPRTWELFGEGARG
jgi:thymidylate synthase (FAD)